MTQSVPEPRRARSSRRKRRSWIGPGRAHVELKGAETPSAAEVVAGAIEMVGAVPGVDRVAWEPGLRRLVVSWSGPGPGTVPAGTVCSGRPDPVPMPDGVVEAIEAAEEAAGVTALRFASGHATHPGDAEAVSRHGVALLADAVGAGVALTGRALKAPALPVELASVVSFADNQPRVRALLESLAGGTVTDSGLAVANAVVMGLAQGPLGLAADAAQRLVLSSEALATRQAWEDADAARWDHHDPAGQATAGRGAGRGPGGPGALGVIAPPGPRPLPLPPGPVERHADRSSLLAGGAGAAALAGSSNGRRAAAMLVAGIAKPARMGREAFAANLARRLANADAVVLDASALRRLDRIDTVVIDAGLVFTGRLEVTGVQPVAGSDAAEVVAAATRLVDPADARIVHDVPGWQVAPLRVGERRRKEVATAVAGVGEHSSLLGLKTGGKLVGVVGCAERPTAAGAHLLMLARHHSLMVALAGGGPDLAEAAGADTSIALDASAVAQLQADGCVVMVVSSGSARAAAAGARAAGARAEEGARAAAGALAAADVGVEVAGTGPSPWTGHVVVDGTPAACALVEAVAAAKAASRHSVALAASASGIGALLAATATPAAGARRAAEAVNLAALAALANGLRESAASARCAADVPTDELPWHALDAAAVLARLRSREAGLTVAEAEGRRRARGAGKEEPEPSLLHSIGAELVNPLTPILAGGAAAAAAVGSVTDGAMVAGVSLLNGVLGGVQRLHAERAIRELGEASSRSVTVRRPAGSGGSGGEDATCPAEELVAGDVVVLRAGDAVPADCRVLAAEGCLVDESAMTGEPEAVRKSDEPVLSSILAERSSMIYEGTTVAAGEVTAVVVAVGADTAAARLAAGAIATGVARGVEGRLAELTSLTLPASLAGGAAMLAGGLLRRRPLSQSASAAVALAVAAVPEGLPLLATMAQLAAARRLSARGALVRNPRAVEALGRVQVLCTDKTGTLTEGRIRLSAVSDGIREVGVDGLDPARKAILAAGLRASPEAEEGVAMAHLTDRAVVEGAAVAGAGAEAGGAEGWVRLSELAFEPARGYHATVGTCAGGQRLSVKGAPETVLGRCGWWASPEGQVPLTARARRALDSHVESLASRGLRILAVAESDCDAPDLDDDSVTGLTLAGFLVLSDPIRPTAVDALSGLAAAGVSAVMVTGDHPSTAKGIAAELGMLDGRSVVTGPELGSMSDAALDAMVEEVAVFARVTPADKVRIVASLRRRGRAVAMTGDGANDAPAIRLADVGVALGRRATASARQAADIIITDERIETIVDAIVEGRAMWTSVREALAILLGGNLGEVAFTSVATLLTGRTPLSARQLLVVNLLTDVAPALAIAVRPPPRHTPEALLAEGPDASLGSSLDRAIAVRAATTAGGAAVAYTIARMSGGRRRASTTALVALVASQLGQTIAGGGLDPVVLAAGGGSALVLAAVVQTPVLGRLFDCTPLDPVAWGIALGSAAAATGASVAGSRLLGAGR